MIFKNFVYNKEAYLGRVFYMIYLLIRWVFYAFVIMFTAWIVPGISVEGFTGALVVAIILALINIFIKPVLQVITLPINILTLGLFSLILNALLLMFAGFLTPGFSVDGFWSALFGSIIISIFGMGIAQIDKKQL